MTRACVSPHTTQQRSKLLFAFRLPITLYRREKQLEQSGKEKERYGTVRYGTVRYGTVRYALLRSVGWVCRRLPPTPRENRRKRSLRVCVDTTRPRPSTRTQSFYTWSTDVPTHKYEAKEVGWYMRTRYVRTGTPE
ncbi:unnamed protein product [Pylaiella littoralis]